MHVLGDLGDWGVDSWQEEAGRGKAAAAGLSMARGAGGAQIETNI